MTEKLFGIVHLFEANGAVVVGEFQKEFEFMANAFPSFLHRFNLPNGGDVGFVPENIGLKTVI
jgi:hypothetical protein